MTRVFFVTDTQSPSQTHKHIKHAISIKREGLIEKGWREEEGTVGVRDEDGGGIRRGVLGQELMPQCLRPKGAIDGAGGPDFFGK